MIRNDFFDADFKEYLEVNNLVDSKFSWEFAIGIQNCP